MAKEKLPPPRAPREIEKYAEQLRVFLGVAPDVSYFNIVSAIENDLGLKLRGFSLQIISREEYSGIEAYTEYGPPRIIVREDIYEAAYRDDVRSRFTLAHELGHLCLHWGCPRARLVRSAQEKVMRSKQDVRIEQEASRFAGALLIPSSIAARIAEPWRLASICRVSAEAASRRLQHVAEIGDALAGLPIRTLFGVS